MSGGGLDLVGARREVALGEIGAQVQVMNGRGRGDGLRGQLDAAAGRHLGPVDLFQIAQFPNHFFSLPFYVRPPPRGDGLPIPVVDDRLAGENFSLQSDSRHLFMMLVS